MKKKIQLIRLVPMVKGFRQIAILTVASRILGMLRDMAFAYFLGVGGLMDGWAIAFKIPNLARRLFGEGAASSSFIPVYSELLHNNPEKAKKLASTVVTVIFVILTCLVLLGEAIIWGYYKFFNVYESTVLKLQLSGIMLPFTILICVVAILGGILNTHRHFAAPATAPIILNIFIIGSLCFSGWVLKIEPQKQVFIVAAFVLLAAVVKILIHLPPLWLRGIYIKPAWDVRTEEFKKVILLMAPMILGLTATQINTLADDFIALWLSGSAEKGNFFTLFGATIKYPVWEGTVSQLYYAQRLYQFPFGVLGISLSTAIFPVMSLDAAKKDFTALAATIARGLRCAIFVAVPATIGLLIIRRPLVTVILQRGHFTSTDTAFTAGILAFYCLGLCGFFMQQIVILAFYSTQDSKAPAKSAAIAVFTNLILNLTLIWFLKGGGLALSTALCSYMQVVILITILRKRFESDILQGLGSAIFKTSCATLCMAAVALAARRISANWGNVSQLLLVVSVSAGVFLLASKLLKIEMLSLLTGSRKLKS